MKNFISEHEIDALLPQTQCGLCGYGGCMPYAKALSEQSAPINLCPPGGIETLRAIGKLLHIDPSPYEAEMLMHAKPLSVAKIREPECIGCAKCIQVCPVDAILGSAKTMHVVISSECTGCELCVPACPVDCIDMVTTENNDQKTKRDHFRNRFLARQQRLAQQKTKPSINKDSSLTNKQSYIQEAIARARAKKLMNK